MGGGGGGESQHQTRQGDGPGSSSLLQAWGGGRQVSAGLGGCLKAEAWEGMGLGGELGPPGALGVGPAGGGEVGLEAVASAPSRSNCGWCNRQRPHRERGLGRGEGASGPEPTHPGSREGGRERLSLCVSASFSSSLLKKEKHSFLEGASVGGSKLRPYALGPQYPRASVSPSEQSAGGTPGTILGS